MTNIIYLNGEHLDRELAHISPMDRGLLLADGLFETIRCDQGKAIRLEQHWQRFKRGCKILRLPLPLSLKEIATNIEQLLKENELNQSLASSRLTFTRGSASRGLLPPKTLNTTLLIQCFPLADKINDPISLMHSMIKINEHSPLRQFKSLAYTENILAREEAAEIGFGDALIYNSQNNLVSTSCANIFLFIDGKLSTPSLSSGALPGVMRCNIIEECKRQEITILERDISKNEIEKAEFGFISNSLIGTRAIGSIGNQALASLPLPYKLLI